MAAQSLLRLIRAVIGRAAALAALLCLSTAFAAPPVKGPAWATLNADQQAILAPLSADWDQRLNADQKAKWVGIAKRYPKMKPEEQRRVQTRMQKWAKLTTQQRWQARERYRSLGKIAPDRREELRRHWAEYQALPPHEKRMFDVPPSYVPPKERRKRAKPAKPAPDTHSHFP